LNEKIDYLARVSGIPNLGAQVSLAKEFKQRLGDYPINYAFPKSWNEKVGYYRTNYYLHSPLSMTLWHKWMLKKWIEKHIGKQYVVPTFGVWDKVEDIDWDKLPKSFVLKTCRGSLGREVIVVHDKTTANKQKILATVQESIDRWYVNVPKERKRIIAEMLLTNSDGSMPVQYEFYCGRGKPLVCRINTHSQTETRSSTSNLIFYDFQNWTKLPIRFRLSATELVPNDGDVEKPKNLDELLRLATEISSYVPIVRVDLYSIDNERIYVGEITAGPGHGRAPIVPAEWDFRLGESIDVIPLHELDQMILRDKEKFSLDEIN